MSKIKIKNRIVGKGHPPFIVAEAGINHNGEIEKAMKMIRVAKKSGVDAIKFQTFKAREFIIDKSQTYTYTSQGKKVTESMLDMLQRCEFTKKEWHKIKKKCDEENITFFSTAQNKTDLELLLELDIPAIKVGSDDFNNLPLLRDYAKSGLPLIVSCGMSNLGEIYESLDAIGTLDGYPTVLLHTTSQYPTPSQDVNLLKMHTLSAAFPNIPLGFSDHTIGHLASSLSVGLGACLLEKHFTLDRNLKGPDHWFAEDPRSLEKWVESIKESYMMLGNAIIRPTTSEKQMRTLARRSIVAIQDINEGNVLDDNNIGLRRPGNGLPPKLIDQIFGLKTTKKITKGTLLKLGDFK